MSKVPRSQLHAETATLTFLLSSQYWKNFKRNIKVEHTLNDGIYCTDLERNPITEEMCKKLTDSINEILKSDQPIEIVTVKHSKLCKYFQERNQIDKVNVLKTWQDHEISCIKYEDFLDYIIEPCSTDKDRLKIFEIRKYADGLVLRSPTFFAGDVIPEFKDPEVLHQMFQEYSEWAKLLKCEYASNLNQLIFDRKVDGIKWVAEGLHEQKLATIADHLVANFDKKKIITIAGPSSSNKTTFAKRLAISLRVVGYQSVIIEMDDYFKDNSEIPFGPDGLQDFEHVSTLNIKLLSERVNDLLNGKTVPRRKFIFKKGVGEDSTTEFITLPPNCFLILEGIHGLNPILLNAFGADRVCPIYVSALTPINIDATHRFPTASLRLIRRLVRDFKFRGHSPRKTLQRWVSVRRGEENNIFPFQANAELFFNSALVYELPVLSIYARGLLAEASIPGPDEDPDDPQSQEVTKEALRLQGFLNFFYPLSVEIVPHTSCLREFVGGSDLKY
ncbi:Phosphoribulokinase / Uridine kinase family protein [Histomonas meleagridis]|uniref:Phosphoribulokinase / Uridine kinase family protein n=1 Tax=Histomonas meleagridis TaxID=135588 RepID=UPI003559C06A|nr:Phosphoribulokinase / Uridine kinase family protein [Histomonas meleagridis]